MATTNVTEGTPAETMPAPPPQQRFITLAVAALCVVIFILFNLSAPPSRRLSDILAPNNVQIWHGAIWGLATSAFVHIAFWHLLFNLMWALDLGRLLEPDMKPMRYLGFIVTAAIVTSGWQLLVSGATGIGYSGVVYALFGYVLARRGSNDAYRAFVTPRTVAWMLGWLVLCVVLTWTGTWSVGNGAHVSGLAFGYLVGWALEHPRRRKTAIALGTIMLAGVVLSCAYQPWSAAWQGRLWLQEFDQERRKAEAGDPHSQAHHGSALMTWPETRTEGLDWLRRSAAAGNLEGMNSLAWWLAVAREGKLRNGAEAVQWAEKAYRGTPTPAVADTLAAAYAETDRWNDAISTQERAVAQFTTEDRKPYVERLELYRNHSKWRE